MYTIIATNAAGSNTDVVSNPFVYALEKIPSKGNTNSPVMLYIMLTNELDIFAPVNFRNILNIRRISSDPKRK